MKPSPPIGFSYVNSLLAFGTQFRRSITVFFCAATAIASLAQVLTSGSAGIQETTVHAFNPQPSGIYPESGLISDAAGNLYGNNLRGWHLRCWDRFRFSPRPTCKQLLTKHSLSDSVRCSAAGSGSGTCFSSVTQLIHGRTCPTLTKEVLRCSRSLAHMAATNLVQIPRARICAS
jgi:hypothetical protein